MIIESLDLFQFETISIDQSQVMLKIIVCIVICMF